MRSLGALIRKRLGMPISGSNLSPERREAFRRMRMVFPPAFPERTAGLFALVRYLAAAEIQGDVVECGVGRGVSFFLLGTFMYRTGLDAQLYGYDSFEGFPEPSSWDSSSRNPKRGEWGDTSIDHVRQHFLDAGMREFFDERCTLVKGFFGESLAELPFKRVSLLHLDVDLYESYRTCGARLERFVDPRGVILFDEYGLEAWPGATKAIDEFVREGRWVLKYARLMDKYLAFAEETLHAPTAALRILCAQLQVDLDASL